MFKVSLKYYVFMKSMMASQVALKQASSFSPYPMCETQYCTLQTLNQLILKTNHYLQFTALKTKARKISVFFLDHDNYISFIISVYPYVEDYMT